MSDLDKNISKSLDEIDAIIGQINAEDLSKAMPPKPEEVSNDAPPAEDNSGEAGGEPNPEANPEAEANSAPAPTPDNDDVPEEGEEGEEEDEYEKSLTNELESDANVKKALEVSDFLSGLVKGLSKVIGDTTQAVSKQEEALNKSINANTEISGIIVKSFEGLTKAQKTTLELQAKMLKSIDGLNDRIAQLESQPVVRKSVPSANKPLIVDKPFEGTPAPKADKLNKSEALNLLNAEFEKGNRNLSTDIVYLESSGNFEGLSSLAKSVLKI